MHRAMICINPTAPDAIGFTTAAGLPGDVRFDFKTITGVAYPNVAALFPQMVLRPFTTPTSYGYDITIDDPTGASGYAPANLIFAVDASVMVQLQLTLARKNRYGKR